jgi:signal transduction histidine kinase/CheY-like chemotaxis protein
VSARPPQARPGARQGGGKFASLLGGHSVRLPPRATRIVTTPGAAAVLDALSDAVWVLGRDWRPRYANRAAAALLQRGVNAGPRATLWQRFPGLRESTFGRQLQIAMEQGGHTSFAAPFPPLAAWCEVQCDVAPEGLTLCLRDVTVQLESETRSRRSQRLEALGQLTGGIAHDVNNLLTVMLGSFEMLGMSAEARGEDGVDDASIAEAGLRAGESASQLMHRLLAFSRRQPLSPRVIAVDALLASLEPLLRRSLAETVVLSIASPSAEEGALWRVLVDASELENALLNLAINARDAMIGGGQLRIVAANVTVDRVYAAAAGMDRIGDFVVLAVADTGTGMTREVVEHAFDPFFTTKAPGQGTGLGLSMVYGFARQSGGHVVIDSEPGRGTIVRLYLPRTLAEPESPSATALRTPQGGRETVLLIEDNALVREHIEVMLRNLGYRVHATAEAAEALLLLQQGLRPDLLFSDMVLPGGLSGHAAAVAAVGLVPELRVLFTTGHTGSVLGEEAHGGAGLDILRKPFRPSELAARLRASLAGPPWRPDARFNEMAGQGARDEDQAT